MVGTLWGAGLPRAKRALRPQGEDSRRLHLRGYLAAIRAFLVNRRVVGTVHALPRSAVLSASRALRGSIMVVKRCGGEFATVVLWVRTATTQQLEGVECEGERSTSFSSISEEVPS